MPARVVEILHAEQEGVDMFLLSNPVRFCGDEQGRLTGMDCIQMELGEPDESGRRRPVPCRILIFILTVIYPLLLLVRVQIRCLPVQPRA